MDNAALPKSALETLRTVEFRMGLRGYDVDEVDDYLEKVAVEADAMTEQLRQTTERLRQAADRIAQLEAAAKEEKPAVAKADDVATAAVAATASTESVQRTLEMAQRFVDQMKLESEQEAARMTSEAEAKARKLEAEAQQRYQADLSRLEGLKSKLSSDVESMARQLEGERTRLRSSLTEMIAWIEDNVQPGAAIMALRQEAGSSSSTATADGSTAPAGLEKPAES
jgi:DivIVA domain-containing protein